MEEKKEKQDKKIGLIVGAVLLIIAVGVGCFFLGRSTADNNSSKEKEKEEKKEELKEEQEEEQKDELKEEKDEGKDDFAKNKLHDIIIKIINCPIVDGDVKLLTQILNGKNGFTDEEKFAIAMRYANTINERVNADEVPDTLKGAVEMGVLAKVTYKEFEDRYKEIFIDDPVINEKTMKNLDMPSSVAHFDSNNRVMYVYVGYGGSCNYTTNFDDYSVVDGNYVVTTTGTYSTENIGTVTIKWTFDKDFRFIKTEVAK